MFTSTPAARTPVAALLAAPFAALATLAMLAGVAHAEAPRFLAEVDRSQVVVGEPFVYQVTLSVGNDQVSDYRPPDFKGLRVLSKPDAPNQSTQMQFGGAGMFVQISYSWRYEVAALQKGAISIGPAHIRVNGQDFRSSLVTVSAAGTSAAAAAGASAGAPSSPPSPMAASPPQTPSASAGSSATAATATAPGALPPEASEGNSFIRLVTDKQKVFVGEAVSATWFLYINQPVDNYDARVQPRTEGFWSEDVTVPSRSGGGGLVLTQEVVEGRPYQVGAILKKALFPLQAGHLTITPMESAIWRSDFFGNPVRSQRVRSMPTVLEVMPLPQAGQPAGFDAANVGNFTLSARVDRSQVAVGEAVTLTIEVGGHGNLRKLVLPSVPKLNGWKAYEPRVNVVVDPSTGVSGTKTAEILLLPERPGTVQIPALVLASFDPEARRYVRAESPPMTLTATGEAAAGGRVAAGAGAPAAGGAFSENVIAAEIRPVHARASLRRDLGTTFFRTRAFAGVLALPPLGFALMLVGFRVRDRLAEDSGPRRRRRARQKVRGHLASAEKHRQRGEAGAFFIEIDRVIRETLTSRLGRPVKGLRIEELRELLGARGLAAAETDRIVTFLEQCDHARFAPSGGGLDAGPTAAAMGASLEEASELIDVVEKARLSDEAPA